MTTATKTKKTKIPKGVRKGQVFKDGKNGRYHQVREINGKRVAVAVKITPVSSTTKKSGTKKSTKKAASKAADGKKVAIPKGKRQGDVFKSGGKHYLVSKCFGKRCAREISAASYEERKKKK